MFRRSSNEDYTLLLRFVGIDRMHYVLMDTHDGSGGEATTTIERLGQIHSL